MKNINYSSICPKKLEQYLLERGWTQESTIDDRAAVMALTTSQTKRYILLPITNDIADYESRLWDLFSTLEIVEQRDRSVIADEINQAELDK